MNLRAYTSATLGIPIVLTPHALDGEVYYIDSPATNTGTTIYLGTQPRSQLELARWRGKWIAQQGLIDWLRYIGEAPIPKHPPTHKDILNRLKAHA